MSENKGNEKIITVIAGIILAVIAVVVVVVVVINSTEVTPSDSVSVSDSGFDTSLSSKTNDVSDLYGMSKEEVEKICGKPEEQLDEGEQRSFAIYGDNNITYNNGFVEKITVYSSDFLEFAGFRVGDKPSEEEITSKIEECGFFIQSVSENSITCVNDNCMVRVVFEDGRIYSIQLTENPNRGLSLDNDRSYYDDDTDSEEDSYTNTGSIPMDIMDLYGMSKKNIEKIYGKPKNTSIAPNGDYVSCSYDNGVYLTYEDNILTSLYSGSPDFAHFAGFKPGDTPSEDEILYGAEEYGYKTKKIYKSDNGDTYCIEFVKDDHNVLIGYIDGEITDIMISLLEHKASPF